MNNLNISRSCAAETNQENSTSKQPHKKCLTEVIHSMDNSYEVVDFTAAASGNFQIKVHKYRFDGVNEYVGVAWSLS